QRTTAEDKGDYYLLNGTKNWITNGSSASVYLVMAQTDVEKGHRGINCLIVEKGMEGFQIGPKENKLGIRGSDTHSLMFTDVKVPKESRIGEDGFGFKFAMQTLSGGRIGIASQASGIASGAMELAVKNSKEGKKFDEEGAIAKLFASKVAMDATVEAVQIHGGYGYVKDYHVERLMRDAKITQIYEGTSEIQKIVISRSVLKD